jgi:phosphoglycolate phosphatase
MRAQMTEASPIKPPALDRSAVRGLVFDLDGTLIDSYGAIAASLNHARHHFALPPLPEDFVRGKVGRGLEQLVVELVGAEARDEGVRLFRSHYAETYADRTHPLPEALATLRRLRERGYRLSVASNKPARFGRAILDRFGMLGLLDVVEGPDTAGTVKPEPAMVRRCLDAMGLEERSTAYVGDMVLDVETAARAALPVILVPGGSSSKDELKGTGELVLSSLSQLPEQLPARAPD